MSATGYIQVRAYTSSAQYPLKNVAIVITATDGTAIAMRLTDQSGKIAPIPFPFRRLPKVSPLTQPNVPTRW